MLAGMMRAAAGDLAAHQLRLELFALGDVLHLFGDDALARQVHLATRYGCRLCRP